MEIWEGWTGDTEFSLCKIFSLCKHETKSSKLEAVRERREDVSNADGDVSRGGILHALKSQGGVWVWFRGAL